MDKSARSMPFMSCNSCPSCTHLDGYIKVEASDRVDGGRRFSGLTVATKLSMVVDGAHNVVDEARPVD